MMPITETDRDMLNYKLDFVQDNKILFEYGIIKRTGPFDNFSDCESDIILTHMPTKEERRFFGTFYDRKYIEEMYEWIIKYPKQINGVIP